MKHAILPLRFQPNTNPQRQCWHPDSRAIDFSRQQAPENPPSSRLPEISPKPGADRRAQRKLAMLQRSGLFAEGTPGIVVERARTTEEFRAAYRLVHDVYVERGYCSEKDWGIRLRIFEATAHMATFIAKSADGAVVGVLSVVGDCPHVGLPSEEAFGAEIAAIRQQGLKLCEVTNQAIAPHYRKSPLPTELMRCAMAHGIMMGYQRAIATVSPGHTGFYNLLSFFAIGPTRSYSQAIDDPVVALCGNLDSYRGLPSGADECSEFIHRYMASDNPFLARVSIWENEATVKFLEPQLLRGLFISASSFLDQCSDSEFVLIEEQWGWHLFDEVTEPEFAEEGSPWTKRRTMHQPHFSHRQLCECWPGFFGRPAE